MEGRIMFALAMKMPMKGGNPRFIVISWASAVGYRRSLLASDFALRWVWIRE